MVSGVGGLWNQHLLWGQGLILWEWLLLQLEQGSLSKITAWVGWGQVSGGGNLVSNWLGWLLSGAWGSGWAILWSVGSIADSSLAVNSIWAVNTVAGWEWLGRLNSDWNPLGQVLLLGISELLALHGNLLAEILISVHANGEEHIISWSTEDSVDSSSLAGRLSLGIKLKESSG